MPEKIKFRGKDLSYNCEGWVDDNKTFLFDFGDGELTDKDGDNYFVHLEYNNETNKWLEEIWWENDHVILEDWDDLTVQDVAAIYAIELLIETNLM